VVDEESAGNEKEGNIVNSPRGEVDACRADMEDFKVYKMLMGCEGGQLALEDLACIARSDLIMTYLERVLFQ